MFLTQNWYKRQSLQLGVQIPKSNTQISNILCEQRAHHPGEVGNASEKQIPINKPQISNILSE